MALFWDLLAILRTYLQSWMQREQQKDLLVRNRADVTLIKTDSRLKGVALVDVGCKAAC